MEKFYQKTWFIILIALMFLSVAGCTDVSASPETTTESTLSIESLSMQYTDDRTIRMSGLDYSSWVKVEPRKFNPDDITFFVMNEEIATIEKGEDTTGALWFKVTPKKPGITGIYAETKDGIKSEVVKITVLE